MMQAGKYYIGDLCYVMGDVWDEVCELINADPDCEGGEFTLSTGVKFAFQLTEHGDGFYDDQFGNGYPVDAGLIGCVRVEDITDPEADPLCFNIVEFEEEFETKSIDGTIYIGDIRIPTDWSDDDEEEDDEEVCSEED